MNRWIKSNTWEYNCDEEYLEELNKGKILKYSSLLAVFSDETDLTIKFDTLFLNQNEKNGRILNKILKIFCSS